MKRMFAVVAVSAVMVSPVLAEELVEAGKVVFKKCMACHVVDKVQNKVGPMLNGVIGRKPGSVEGFKYSEAMVAHGATVPAWTEEEINKYLADPKGYVPKNKMAFAGLKEEKDRLAVIAYIKSVPPVAAATQ
jgi:S-disulfanyl-L-cysteine oxidoreductase SoxD